ncbi:MAG TPA: HAMP domain-containing sensor histidine kinase [Gemmatimonadaceae bacterium]|nr:HAMP domain-containing sensor histidine kinase [Gemmatimonadaceae bacterium]
MSSRIPPRPPETAVNEASVQNALRRYMEHAPLPFAVTRGVDHNLAYANAPFCHLAGIGDGRSLGDPITSAFAGSERNALNVLLDRAFRDGAAVRDEEVYTSRAEGTVWRCTAWPVVDDHGRPEALGVELRTVDRFDGEVNLQRELAEKMLISALRETGIAHDAESARRRAAFLAEAGRLLAQSVDQSSTLIALAKLALPMLGSWCIVDIVAAGKAIQRLPIVHPDPEKHLLAQRLAAPWCPEPDDPFGAPAMIRAQRTIAITGDEVDAALTAAAHSAENLYVLRQLSVHSLLSVPLVARGRLLGAVTFVGADEGRALNQADVQLAEDLAARGALALDNAQAYDAALTSRRVAESANRAKTAFLGAMSHELRTPLNAIGGYVELVDMGLRGPVTTEQRSDLARIKANQQYLLSLITDILNFVSVGSGRLSYAAGSINLLDCMTQAVALVEPLFSQRELTWGGITCKADIAAYADSEKVIQIVVNLLSNAIKFTPSGGKIAADCAIEADMVLVTVSDTGIGIPADKHESIFEPFVQLKDGLTNRAAGVGLGLAISRDLARAMKGDLTVESSEGKGVRFNLALPRRERSRQ